jgi:hypothetical protein
MTDARQSIRLMRSRLGGRTLLAHRGDTNREMPL